MNSKSMLGELKNGKWHFSTSEKHAIIQDYLSSGATKQAIWKKYTGQQEEHGTLLRWMRQLGYLTSSDGEQSAVADVFPMKEKREAAVDQQAYADLVAENAALKQALEETALALKIERTVIEVAEKQLGLDLRKKSATQVSES